MSAELKIDQNTICTVPIEGGYAWTLASRLGDMLRLAKEMFGPRNLDYTLLGIEFINGIPQVWYPGDCKDIVIQLDLQALGSMSYACYQLAHEAVHLLSPNGGGCTNNFEEGLATYFAGFYMREEMQEPSWHPTEKSYKKAVAAIEPFLLSVPDGVRKLREEEPNIYLFTADQLRRMFPKMSLEDSQFLAEKFQRDL
jgi:hypothetical protein